MPSPKVVLCELLPPGRGVTWTPKNKKPEKLRDTLRECEVMVFSSDSDVYITFISHLGSSFQSPANLHEMEGPQALSGMLLHEEV